MSNKDAKDVNNIMQNNNNKPQSSGNELLEFFLGVILLGLGLYMLFKKTIVHSGWYSWSFGGIDFSSGLMILPFIIGVIWYFYNPKSVFPKILIALGVIIVVATVIMSVRIRLSAMTLWDYILIIGMCAAGAGLLLKTLFKKRQ